MTQNLTPADMAVEVALKIERFKILRLLEQKSKEEVINILETLLKKG
ncbi:MAG TPA: hypothetical protein GXZ61_05630 [Clostridiales bacterium]|jgi:hypothetical protein|nr:hypothetical protein [Clostridiales bacterium]